MNKDKFIKGLKIFIIVLAVILIIAIPVSILTYGSNTNNLKTNTCTEKGNICTFDEIFEGVEVLVEVTDGKEYVFNVISNDENTMTLQMNKNLKREVNWHSELTNVKGPQNALETLLTATNKWNNIAVITDYQYTDFGKTNYETSCSTSSTEPDYDCSNDYHLSRGYNSLTIKDGVLTINTNMVSVVPDEVISNVYTFSDYQAKVRLITYEEVTSLVKEDAYPDWLISNLDEYDGYWTLTSATSMKVNYSQGATALARLNKTTSIENLYVLKEYDASYTIGIRPVITIEKK